MIECNIAVLNKGKWYPGPASGTAVRITPECVDQFRSNMKLGVCECTHFSGMVDVESANHRNPVSVVDACPRAIAARTGNVYPTCEIRVINRVT